MTGPMAVADQIFPTPRPTGKNGPIRHGAAPPGAVTGISAQAFAAMRLPWPVTLYLLCLLIPVWFNVGPLALSLLRLFLMVAILPLLVRLFMGRFGGVLLTDVLFIAHIVWATLALAVNNPGEVVSQIGSVGVEFLGGYLVGRAYIRSPEVFFALCRWLVASVFWLVPFAIYETLTGNPIAIELIRKLPGITSVANLAIDRRLGLERVQAVFAHPIHFGLYCSVAFSLSFVALRGLTTNLRRWISSIIIGIMGFLALSSGALLAICLQIGLIVWAAAFARVRARWWLLVGLFALIWVVIDLLSNRSPLQVFMSYATFSSHTAYWRGIIFDWGLANVLGSTEKGLVGSPWVGIGLHDWVRPWFMYSSSVDNFWLLMAMRYGIPGFLLLAWGYAWVIFLIMRRDFSDDPVLAQIQQTWVFTFLGLTFTLCTVHVWASVYSFVFFMFGGGVWLIAAQPAATPDPGSADPDTTDAAPRGPRYSRFPVGAAPRHRSTPA
jgi:hypothetical protein